MTGSIEKRGKDSYRLVVFKGYDLDGKSIRHQKTIHCKNKSEARTELAKYIAQVENGFVVDGTVPTFKEFVEIWKRDYGSKELAPGTYRRYLSMLESRILPYLSHFRLDKLKPTDIMKFYDMLERDTQIRRIKHNNGYRTLRLLSQKTILEHHRLIRAMLHKAVYWQLLYSNPCERVQPPKTRKPKRRYYDDEQCKTLISGLNELSADEIKYKVAIILTVFTGVRLGELMGLDWENIDFRNKEITVNKSSQYLASTGVYTKPPKTPSSFRHISIPDSVIDILEEYKLWYDSQKELCGEFWEESNRLFIQDNGKPMHPDTVSKWFVKFVQKIGLPYLNFHGIRHTNATLLISQNVDVAVVAARLGHAQTFNFYVHPLASHNRSAGIVLQNLLVDKN